MRTLKQISLALILIVGMINNLYAQIIKASTKPPEKIVTFCATPAGMPATNFQLIQSGSSSGFYDLSTASACVKLYFHVIRQSDGTGGVSIANVNQSFYLLNSDFNPGKIYFHWDGQIDYINNSTLYNNPKYGSNQTTPPTIFSINNHFDGVDIYIFPDTSSSFNGGVAYGVGNNPQLLISGSLFGFVMSRSPVISHELGHVLGLWHTHHGTINEIGDFGIPADVNQCSELVNGSNSHICGDYVSDTPADPFIGFNVNYLCQWLNSGTDANGHYYNPDTRNIMGYTKPDCMHYFSSKQFERMLVAMLNIPFLQNVSNVSLDPLQNGHTICDGISSINFNMHPNPVSSELKIEVQDSLDTNLYKIKLYSLFNDNLLQKEIFSKSTTIDTSNLPNGIYFVSIKNETKTITKILIINH